jgi:hypothetical protein
MASPGAGHAAHDHVADFSFGVTADHMDFRIRTHIPTSYFPVERECHVSLYMGVMGMGAAHHLMTLHTPM